VAVAIPWSRSRQRSTSSSRVASEPVGNFSPSPASAGRPRPAQAPGPGSPGCGRSLSPTTPRSTPVGADPGVVLLRPRTGATLDPDLEGVPERGRMAASVSRVRSDEEHNTTVGRTSTAARWAARTSAARRPPRRQRPVGIGKAWILPAGLGMAEQPEALHSGASVVAVRVPRSLGMAQSGLTRDVVVVVVLTGFPGRLGSWPQGTVQGGIVPLDDWQCADSFGGGPMASRADSRVDPLL